MLQFVRQIPIRIVIKDAPLEVKRGFLFQVAAGFNKNVDPESGMSVNLVLVDRWLLELQTLLESQEVLVDSVSDWRFAVLQQAQQFLSKNAGLENAQLVSLDFAEVRGSSFSWDHDLPERTYFAKFAEYVEFFAPAQKFDLVRLELVWRCSAHQISDLKKIGKKLIRRSSQKGAEHFVESLQKTLGFTLSDESRLQKIEIHHLAEAYKLTLLEA